MLRYLHRKDDLFTVFLFVSLSLVLMILPSEVCSLFPTFCQRGGFLLVGIVLILAAIPSYRITAKSLTAEAGYVLCILFNGIANGCIVATLYGILSTPLPVPVLLSAAFPSFAVILFLYIMLKHCWIRRKTTLRISLVVCLLLLLYAAIRLFRDFDGFYGFMLACGLIPLHHIFSFVLTISKPHEWPLKQIAFCSFGPYILITLIVLLLLSDGNADFCWDFDGLFDNLEPKSASSTDPPAVADAS